MAKTSAGRKARSVAEDARDSVVPAAESAFNAIGTAAETAFDAIGTATEQTFDSTKDKVGPVIEDARDRLAPVVGDAQAKIAPVVAAAVLTGRRKGRVVAERVGIVEKKKSHKLRNLLVTLGLGGVAAFVYAKLAGKDTDPAWTSSRDSAATDSPRHAASPVAEEPSDDSSAATGVTGTVVGTSEAAAAEQPVSGSDTAPTAPFPSEETAESPVPTTPDQPLQSKDV